jgi:hypothetical protein
LIDIAIPDYSKFNAKKLKNQASTKTWYITVSRMWKVRTKIVPVMIGALGIIKK